VIKLFKKTLKSALSLSMMIFLIFDQKKQGGRHHHLYNNPVQLLGLLIAKFSMIT